jgi:hypothetical protein
MTSIRQAFLAPLPLLREKATFFIPKTGFDPE